MKQPDEKPGGPSVAIVGGGLAGMAAAVAATEHGLRVELFERRKQLGGRAGSFHDPRIGRPIDYCQHVAMGCCTNLIDFCRRTGIDGSFQRHTDLHFFGPNGKRSDFVPAGWLPAPLHLFPALMRLGYLSLRERLGIARALSQLARDPVARDDDSGSTIGQWLRQHGQSDRALERFWSVVLVSALSETVDRASTAAARKVFVDGFVASREAYELEIPELPLSDLFDRRLGAWLTQHEVTVHRSTPIRQVDGDATRATGVILADATCRKFDFVVVAVPWHRIGRLLSEPLRAAMPNLSEVESIPSAAITAVHLWFDRPITELPHAVLVGKLSQWLFNGRRQDTILGSGERGHYYQVVISAAHNLNVRDRTKTVAKVREELAEVFPDARAAQLLHWRTTTQPAAVFSVRPGLDRVRPTQQTPVKNLALAGDWTATGWPATMEGAVRSGYLAIEAILRSQGKEQPVLAPDLPRSRLARLLFGNPV
ncbi:MAG: hydroxysqualene dehydroxylase HpnE [Thermoguttaceae bacterium]